MIENLLQAERLLLHGLVDQAELIYQRTLDADPRNAIALVGLARVALERADDRLAYRHTCAALEIDRHNPAALRLEARLSEILTARGEGVERPAWLASDAPPIAPPTAPPDRPADTIPEPSGEPAVEPPIDQAAERAVFARNPSMDDHRRMESQREGPPPAPAPDERVPAADERAPEPPPERRGLLRRLLGR